MTSIEIGRPVVTLPPDDDHPYRTGAWQPTFTEWDAPELDEAFLEFIGQGMADRSRDKPS